MKTRANLMNLVELMNRAPRCSARSKRSGCRCRAPAVRSWTVCRFHGARGGAPKGKANGAWRHGMATDEMIEARRDVAGLFRDVRKQVAVIGAQTA